MQFGKLAVEMIELMATTELMETITQGRVTTTLHKYHENSFKVLAVPLVNQARPIQLLSYQMVWREGQI